MPEEINNKEQDTVLLDGFPSEIKNILLSEDNTILIASICLENGVEDDKKIEKIAYQTTMLLLERISKEDFPLLIERELQIDGITARKISDEINEYILSQLPQPEIGGLPIEKNETVTVKEEKQKTAENDAYKEPIE
jgi:hypothetical protein